MGGGRSGGFLRAMCSQGRSCAMIGSPAVRVLGCFATLLLTTLALTSANAWAEPLCTDTWTGPGEGTWQTAADWSAEHVPTSSDVACIGSGKTVKVTTGTDQSGVVQGEGALAISGGSLELTNSLAEEASRIHSLMLEGGTLTGAATLNVSAAFSWTGGTMSGAGSTVLESGVTSGSINPGVGNVVSLTKRTLTNNGTLTWSTGSVEGRSNAEIDNGGTLNANADVSGAFWSSHGLLNSDGSNVWLENTGTVRKTAGTEFTQIQFQIDNEGTVEATTGQIILSGGSHSGGSATGSWVASEGASLSFNGGTYSLGAGVVFKGVIALAGGGIQAADIQAPNANILLWSAGGALELTNASTTSHVKEFTIKSGTTLSGAATLKVSGEFSWTGGTMSGSGSTVLESGVASGSINPGAGNAVALTKRKLVNEGTVTWSTGSVEGRSSAEFDNVGTLNANANVSGGEYSSHGLLNSDASNVWMDNTGTVRKTAGTEFTQIQFQIANEGKVEASTGQIIFSGGSHSGSTPSGLWRGSESGSLSFNGGSYTMGAGVEMEGAVFLAGGSIHAGDIQASNAHIYLWSAGGTLELTGTSTPSHVKELTINVGTTLNGAATLHVSSSFSWTGGTMSGSGSIVLESGATSSVASKATPVIAKRSLVNEGSLTIPLEAGISGKEGAAIINHGTLTVNGEGEGEGLNAATPGPTPTLTNTGTLQKTEGSGISRVGFEMDNEGVVSATSGQLEFRGGGVSGKEKVSSWSTSGGAVIVFGTGSYTLGAAAKLSGGVIVSAADVTAGKLEGAAAALAVINSGCCEYGTVEATGPGTSSLSGLLLAGGGTFKGAGNLEISSALSWGYGTIAGSGDVVVKSTTTGTIEGDPVLDERALINDGTLTWSSGYLEERNGAHIYNENTFDANSESGSIVAGSGATPFFVNEGVFQKTAGTETTRVKVEFSNFGTIQALTGHIEIQRPVEAERASQWGPENPSAIGSPRSSCGDPVNCVTGNATETQTDLSIGGRGVGLDLTRSYNSQAGASGEHGAFGYGWNGSFSDHLLVNEATKVVTLYQANGSTVPFGETGGGTFTEPAWTQDTLTGTSGEGYTLTLANQTKYQFNGSGRLESVTDRDGNQTTLGYTEGHLTTITDPTGRKITLAYNGEGLVESAKDPLGHTVKYTYESGDLKSVTLPGEESARWQFKYDGSHQMTEMIDGRSGKTINGYDGSNRVVSQKDPLGHTLKFEYEVFQTKITNEATGSVTLEKYTSADLVNSIIHGYGTASASTQTFLYNAAGEPLTVTDGNGHTTTYAYNGSGDKTSMIDANNNETKWTYDVTHDVETMTTPKGETTTIKREVHGNPETIKRPAPGSTTQTTKYKYTAHGELESVTDPLEHIWKYEYDAKGNRTAETDPEGDKRTWEYNEDSQEIASVSPRGNVEGAEAAKYTTATERDPQGRPLKITDPLGHTTKYTYDGDGNVETTTDANSHKTTYTYNANNQATKVKAPDGTVTETEYDGAGRVIGQIDGSKHETKYVRNVLGEVTEVVDPLGRKTTKEYDKAGNLTSLTDPAKRTATYKYDAANRLKEITYSDGITPTVKYTYDEDGDRTGMTDGTGTTTYGYDQLDRLTESKDGHGDTAGYEYNLANEQTKITYPNGKAVERVYDKAGRLEKVTDWLEHTTKFSYDPDSNLTATTFPSGTGEEDKYLYNEADQMSETKMKKGAETQASLVYKRDNVGQLTKTTSIGLPGAEVTSYAYDENDRLTEAGANAYEYDAASNPTKTPGNTNVYDEADELEKGTSVMYSYDELGERTKTSPSGGPATSYGYDEAGNLTSVKRLEEGVIPAIEDTYAYDGNGLRASQTIGGTTHYLTWGMTGELPLILSDGQNSYIYGPGNVSIEQISSGGEALFLHHDQQGSTRMLTDTGGTVKATMTYDAYGSLSGHTGSSTTPLGYDDQYTDQDTGLIYMRAREYDPKTAQFLNSDPIEGLTLVPYSYVNDNPLNFNDPTGLIFGIPGTPSAGQIAGTVESAASGTVEILHTAGKTLNSVAHYAAPALDVTAAGACIVLSDGLCAAALGGNFILQQALVADQAIYDPNYSPGPDEAVAFAGLGLGGSGLLAVASSELQGLARAALGGAIVSPQVLLDLLQALSPEEAQAFIACQ